jgi:hypothetical protein
MLNLFQHPFRHQGRRSHLEPNVPIDARYLPRMIIDGS